jgi:hypothetical protein
VSGHRKPGFGEALAREVLAPADACGAWIIAGQTEFMGDQAGEVDGQVVGRDDRGETGAVVGYFEDGAQGVAEVGQ